MKFAILIIWLGAGNTEVLDTMRLENMVVCEAARSAVMAKLKDESLLGTDYSDNVYCVSVGE